jgi:hypothetical protein
MGSGRPGSRLSSPCCFPTHPCCFPTHRTTANHGECEGPASPPLRLLRPHLAARPGSVPPSGSGNSWRAALRAALPHGTPTTLGHDDVCRETKLSHRSLAPPSNRSQLISVSVWVMAAQHRAPRRGIASTSSISAPVRRHGSPRALYGPCRTDRIIFDLMFSRPANGCLKKARTLLAPCMIRNCACEPFSRDPRAALTRTSCFVQRRRSGANLGVVAGFS